jgi:hypothetical protein
MFEEVVLEKKTPRDLTTGALIEAWGVSPKNGLPFGQVMTLQPP